MRLFFLFVLVFIGFSDTLPAQENNLIGLFKELNPSVVTIQTTEFKVKDAQIQPSQGIGSGVIIEESGLIITAAHVVESANEILVKLEDERSYQADIVKIVSSADVALLKLKSPPADLARRVAKIGDTRDLQIGQDILVIGAPFGLEHSLSQGIVSGRMKRQMVLNGEAVGFIQTDAAINQGNSGGPMFNPKGELIGIVSFILSRGGGFDGIGFAVDINSAKKVLLENNSFWTGFDGVFLNRALAELLNVPQSSGLLVQRVTSNTLAESMGLRGGFFQAELLGQKLWLGGDIILSIQGSDCRTPQHLPDIREQILGLQKGEAVTMTVLRKGQVVELKANM